MFELTSCALQYSAVRMDALRAGAIRGSGGALSVSPLRLEYSITVFTSTVRVILFDMDIHLRTYKERKQQENQEQAHNIG